MSSITIPFYKAYVAGKELEYIARAVSSGEIKGDGIFTERCHQWFEEKFKCPKVLLTNSCTAALEMAAILCGVQEGDEVVLPSYTFVSTVNAFLMRGGRPVFVDIREDTLNLDESQVEGALTARTKVLVPVHYAGVGCEIDPLLDLAREKNLFVVEDAAQGMMAKYKDRYLGTLGDFGTYSFHETKNYSSGEGGALLINNPEHIRRAEIIREKGTNRSQFFRGEVDKYSWMDVGSSYLPSDIVAAFLYAQLEQAEVIHKVRLEIWKRYWDALKPLADEGLFRLPVLPENTSHNAHMFYLILPDASTRGKFLEFFRSRGVEAVFHYVPLHLSPMGRKLGYAKGDFPVTERLSASLVRLPFYNSLTEEEQGRVIGAVREFFGR